MQFFYDPTLEPESTECSFSKEESNHMIRVLRKKVGEEILVTNGRGYTFTGEIVDPSLHKCRIAIRNIDKTVPKMYRLHLAVAPTKNMDRFEWFLEKATEIGIDEISPIICDRSERKVIKRHRLEKVILSAMKQSKRTFLPKLNDAISFNEFLGQDHYALRFIAHCQEGEKAELKRRVAPDSDVLVLIGPEGDFSDREIQLAYSHGFLAASLGEYRLRTETAAILACSTVSFINTR